MKQFSKVLLTAIAGASTVDQLLETYFPEAVSGKSAQMTVANVMDSLGMTGPNTAFAESSCPDELNHDSFTADISERLGAQMGEVFILGGLAGVPFVGSAGWNAFAHHVPDGGNVFVLYAPHVGISETGKVGKVHRPGMPKETSACGSAVGAFNALVKDPTVATAPPAPFDYEQSYMM